MDEARFQREKARSAAVIANGHLSDNAGAALQQAHSRLGCGKTSRIDRVGIAANNEIKKTWAYPMKKLILFLFFPITCFGQDINGKWCAEYNSANGDGQFSECIIIQQNTASIDALRWVTAQCNKCKTVAERKPRLHSMPVKARESSPNQILASLGLKYINGELVEVGGSPSGEDVVFERDSKFIMKPSFNCLSAKQDREKAICGSSTLSLLDLELSLVFDMARQCSSRGTLEKEQNNWWKDELSMCRSGDCVPKFYSERISHLRKICK